MARQTICAVLLLVQLLLAFTYGNHQTYPGTKTRPVLSDSEAAHYTKEAYLQGWTPSAISHSKADYVVGVGGYSRIQAAVDDAILAGGTTRKYIHIKKGSYEQAVLIPPTTVPLTIYGTIGSPEDVHIKLTLSAPTTGAQYANEVNPYGKVYKEGDPAWNMYHYCASKETIGTACSSIFWAKNDNLELAYITIENPATNGQAVALYTDGDMQHYDHVHLYGFQDTLCAGGKRIYFNKPTIKGDVDFIFGGSSAVFEAAQIIARGDRRDSAVVFAPNTDKTQKYGYLLMNSKITADNKVKEKKGVNLARAWDSSSNANGQVVIRETEIVDVLNVNAPYTTGAGGRAYSGNVATNRNLDDPNYNRFWEYKNTGSGA